MMTTKNFQITWTEKDSEGNEVKYYEESYYEAAMDACNKLLRKIVGDDDSAFGMVHLQNMDCALFEKVDMGVNWCCEGKQEPARAAKVGQALQAAAIMAENFPHKGYTIAYTSTKDWTDEDREHAKNLLDEYELYMVCSMSMKLERAGIVLEEA